MRNVPLDDNNIDVQVCDNDDVFSMVNVGLPGQDIESKTSTALNTVTLDAIEAAANIIKYFDLDNNVEDDEIDEGMEIVAMLKSAACDIHQQHDANKFAIAQKRARNE
ncbi:unnamed protein product [Sphagnum troendelagicum]